MSDFESLVAELNEEYPHLILELSGPWQDRFEEERVWICNFKNKTLSLGYVHSGSKGETMFEALSVGMDYLSQNAHMSRIQNCDPADDAGKSPAI